MFNSGTLPPAISVIYISAELRELLNKLENQMCEIITIMKVIVYLLYVNAWNKFHNKKKKNWFALEYL